MSSVRRQNIIWTSADLLLTGLLEAYVSELTYFVTRNWFWKYRPHLVRHFVPVSMSQHEMSYFYSDDKNYLSNLTKSGAHKILYCRQIRTEYDNVAAEFIAHFKGIRQLSKKMLTKNRFWDFISGHILVLLRIPVYWETYTPTCSESNLDLHLPPTQGIDHWLLNVKPKPKLQMLAWCKQNHNHGHLWRIYSPLLPWLQL